MTPEDLRSIRIGPRNSVVSALMGTTYDWLRDTSPWVNWCEMIPNVLREVPEFWVDKIHDFVGEYEINE